MENFNYFAVDYLSGKITCYDCCICGCGCCVFVFCFFLVVLVSLIMADVVIALNLVGFSYWLVVDVVYVVV